MAESENMAISSPSKPWSETRNGRITVAASMVGLFVLVFWLAIRSRQMLTPMPALVVEEQYLSFGEVWEDPAFVWTLPIRNATHEDIEVINFITDCTCGKIEPRSLKIPAQGTREVRPGLTHLILRYSLQDP